MEKLLKVFTFEWQKSAAENVFKMLDVVIKAMQRTQGLKHSVYTGENRPLVLSAQWRY